MGYVVTVYSSKGGVGKTTLSTNMGASLSHKGYKVLIIVQDIVIVHMQLCSMKLMNIFLKKLE